MFYVFRKKDGAILSICQDRSIIKENESFGVLESSQVVLQSDRYRYRVHQGKLEEINPTRRRRERVLSAERRRVRQGEICHSLWSLLDAEDFDLEKVRACLRLIAQSLPNFRREA